MSYEEKIALRAWAEPEGSAHATGRKKQSAITRPQYALVIDTETTIDTTQALNFGSYRFIALDDGKHAPGSCLEEGIFYADELPQRYPEGLAILQQYIADNEADLDVPRYRKQLPLYSRHEFVVRRFDHRLNRNVTGAFWRAAYKARALVVGFNLPFDLSRLAVEATDARRSYGGGFSFALWDYQDKKDGIWRPDSNRPRLVVKSLNSKQHLFRFTDRRIGDPEDYDPWESDEGDKHRSAFSGHFLDLRTLAFSLTDKGYSLEKACEDFDVEHGKQKTAEHGKITPDYIDYNRRDVKATGELLVKLLEEFDRHPISLQVTKAFSPASLAKSYQKAMAIDAVLARQTFSAHKLGYAMNAFYGGRAECRIRRKALPVVYTDFVSMYPTVNALLGNWAMLTAGKIGTAEARQEVSAFLDAVRLEDCFSPKTWRRLPAFVKVRPQDDIFPVRVKYDRHGPSWQIGSNPLTCDDGVWYALPDVVAAKLLTGKTPEVLEAFRLEATGTQDGMRPTKLRGAVPVDPRTQDFFRLVIEERKRTQRNTALSETERDRLDKALKVTANAGSYGIFAEMNRKEQPGNRKVPVTVWNSDGQPFVTKVAAPEEPGPYCFPPLAALITSAARLMLALLECSVRERGGAYVFCDTDSLAIVASGQGGLLACPGGEHRLPNGREAVKALSWPEVEEVRQRFAPLNPYDPDAVRGSVLKAEDENFDDPDDPNTQRELYCYGISAKRYVLYNLDSGGRPVIRKYSRHGLGHLLNPTDPDSREHDWIEEIWQYIIAADVLGETPAEPAWFSRPALGRVGINDPRTLELFKALNKGKPYAEQIKPQNFLLSAQVALFGHPPGVDPAKPFHLVAPYHADPGQWLKQRFTDRYSGKGYRVTVGDAVAQGVARVKTYGDVVAEYRCHREHKSLAPDGQPCGQVTGGVLQRRPVEALEVAYVGKESNRLEEVQHGLIEDEDEIMNEYPDPSKDPFLKFVVPVLKDIPRDQLAALCELHPDSLKRIIAGRRPHAKMRERLSSIAIAHAREALASREIEAPKNGFALLRCYVAVCGQHQRTCPVCGEPVVSPRATYCGARCRVRANRHRTCNAEPPGRRRS